MVWENQSEKSFRIKYAWSVYNGKIVSGQGTPTISVSTDSLAETINATVNIEVLPDGCEMEASTSGLICECIQPYLIDEFSKISDEDTKARLDNLLISLQSDPSVTGYIINYGSTKENSKREKLFKDYIFNIKRQNESRIKFINGGKEKEIRTRFWIVPAGANPSTID